MNPLRPSRPHPDLRIDTSQERPDRHGSGQGSASTGFNHEFDSQFRRYLQQQGISPQAQRPSASYPASGIQLPPIRPPEASPRSPSPNTRYWNEVMGHEDEGRSAAPQSPTGPPRSPTPGEAEALRQFRANRDRADSTGYEKDEDEFTQVFRSIPGRYGEPRIIPNHPIIKGNGYAAEVPSEYFQHPGTKYPVHSHTEEYPDAHSPSAPDCSNANISQKQGMRGEYLVVGDKDYFYTGNVPPDFLELKHPDQSAPKSPTAPPAQSLASGFPSFGNFPSFGPGFPPGSSGFFGSGFPK